MARSKAEAAAADADAKAKAEARTPKAAAAPAAGRSRRSARRRCRRCCRLKYVTLGSLDMDSGYRMLVTLTNAGAAVHRAEMASSRFRDQHDWSGYLGELELKNVPGGVAGAGRRRRHARRECHVRWQAAPLEAGDVIVGIGDPQTTDDQNGRRFQPHARSDASRGRTLRSRFDAATIAPQAADRAARCGGRSPCCGRKLKTIAMRDAQPPADFVDRPSFLTTLATLDNKPLSKDDAKRLAELLETGNWELVGQRPRRRLHFAACFRN